MQFSQPAWTEDSGLPYPGAEAVEGLIEKFQEQQKINDGAKVEKQKALARKKGIEEAEKESASLRKISTFSAASVVEERLVWLWRNRIPLGEITLLAGRGGVGKSTLAMQLAAWVTVGDMKGEFYHSPQNVVIVINEDNIKNVVVPRLRAAGADMDRVFFVTMQDITGEIDRLTLPSDIANLRAVVREKSAALVILDPMSSNLRGKKNDGDEMRPILERIRREIAEECQCAVLGIAHLRKGQSVDIVEGIIGSSEIGNVARSAMGVVEDPDDPDAIILSQEKGNMSAKGLESFRYKIQTHQYFSDAAQTFIETSRLEWLDPTMTRASDVLADRASGGDGSTSDAVDWLRGFLSGGPKTRKEILDEARKHHYGEKKIRAARTALKVVSSRSFGKEAEWSLP